MNSIILPKDFDESLVTFSDVKMLDNGGKIVYVGYNKAPLVMQTPSMHAPYGIQNWDETTNYTLDVSFKGMDKSPNLQAFYQTLEKLDNKLIEDGFANQGSWFKGKKYGSKEIVEALYTRLLRHAKDKETGDVTDKYPPTFKMKIPFRDGKFACEVYNDKRENVDLSTIQTKGSKVTAIIQCTGLWFAGGKFGCSWKVLQMKITPSQTIRGYAFQEVVEDKVEEDIDNVSMDDADVLDNAVDKPPSDDENIVSDSEEEDELEKVSAKKTTKKVAMKCRN